jgi:hypothetical protein
MRLAPESLERSVLRHRNAFQRQVFRRYSIKAEKALALVDIRVLDHVIVGDETTCLCEQGLV